jgi:hypothetical protein
LDIVREINAKMTICGSKYDFSYFNVDSNYQPKSILHSKSLANNVIRKISQKLSMPRSKGKYTHFSTNNVLNKQLSTIKTSVRILGVMLKIKAFRDLFARQIKRSEDLFIAIDAHFDERIQKNTINTKYYHQNVMWKGKLERGLVAKSVEFSTSKSIFTIHDEPEKRRNTKSSFWRGSIHVKCPEEDSLETEEDLFSEYPTYLEPNTSNMKLHTNIYSDVAKNLLEVQKNNIKASK